MLEANQCHEKDESSDECFRAIVVSTRLLDLQWWEYALEVFLLLNPTSLLELALLDFLELLFEFLFKITSRKVLPVVRLSSLIDEFSLRNEVVVGQTTVALNKEKGVRLKRLRQDLVFDKIVKIIALTFGVEVEFFRGLPDTLTSHTKGDVHRKFALGVIFALGSIHPMSKLIEVQHLLVMFAVSLLSLFNFLDILLVLQLEVDVANVAILEVNLTLDLLFAGREVSLHEHVALLELVSRNCFLVALV